MSPRGKPCERSVVVFNGETDFKTEGPAGGFSVARFIDHLKDQIGEALSLKGFQFCVGRLESRRLALARKPNTEQVQSLQRRRGIAASRSRKLAPTVADKRTLRHDCFILRRVCMRIDPLFVWARASRDAQLPLPRLPALQWRSFRFRRRCLRTGHKDHRYAEDVLRSCWQRQSHDPQLLLRLWRSAIHA